MIKTYITFGQIHVHSVNGKTFDKNCIALIEGDHDTAMEIFKGEFHRSIPEDKFNPKEMLPYFPRGVIEL